jgi:hypothetical protein
MGRAQAPLARLAASPGTGGAGGREAMSRRAETWALAPLAGHTTDEAPWYVPFASWRDGRRASRREPRAPRGRRAWRRSAWGVLAWDVGDGLGPRGGVPFARARRV